MKIIKSDTDSRGYQIFIVKTKCNKQEIEEHFEELFVYDVSAMELLNLRNTWQITLLPKEDLVESE
jgi:ribosomal protein L23